jgi:hypothetical protein
MPIHSNHNSSAPFASALLAFGFLTLPLSLGAFAKPLTLSGGAGRFAEAGQSAKPVVAGQVIPSGGAFQAGDAGAAFSPFAGADVFLGSGAKVSIGADGGKVVGMKLLSGAVSYTATPGATQAFPIAVSAGSISVSPGSVSVLASGNSVRVSAVSGVVSFSAPNLAAVRIPAGSVLGVTPQGMTLTDLAAKKVSVLSAGGKIQSTRDASAGDLKVAQAAAGLVPVAEGPAVAGGGGGAPVSPGVPLAGSSLLGSPNPANTIGGVNSPAQ